MTEKIGENPETKSELLEKVDKVKKKLNDLIEFYPEIEKMESNLVLKIDSGEEFAEDLGLLQEKLEEICDKFEDEDRFIAQILTNLWFARFYNEYRLPNDFVDDAYNGVLDMISGVFPNDEDFYNLVLDEFKKVCEQ